MKKRPEQRAEQQHLVQSETVPGSGTHKRIDDDRHTTLEETAYVSKLLNEFTSAKPIAANVKQRACTKCNRRYSIEHFEGYKRCQSCREKNRLSQRRQMKEHTSNGIGYKIPLTDAEQDKIIEFFGHACAFCRSTEHLKFTRLVKPRDGGSDDPENMVLSCMSCIRSRCGCPEWDEWYARRTDIYDAQRNDRILLWIEGKPLSPVKHKTHR